jgi:hypothetical protein
MMNVFGRGLNSALPEEAIAELHSRWTASTPTTANHERLRACMALDWLVRTWLARWSALIPGDGQQVAASLAGLAPIRDLQTAQAAGAVVNALSIVPANAENLVATNFGRDNFYESITASSARQASAAAVAASAGVAVADAVASVVLDECLAAKVDVALTGAAALALVESLDGIWPYVQQWASGPGNFDAKRMSISALAPTAGEMALKPTVEALQREAFGLYVDLCRLG